VHESRGKRAKGPIQITLILKKCFPLGGERKQKRKRLLREKNEKRVGSLPKGAENNPNTKGQDLESLSQEVMVRGRMGGGTHQRK